jgi:hypothetical protein
MDLVFLYGPAAAGKLTVARALAARTGYPVFHNHLVVDAVGAVFAFGSEPFVRLRQDFWLTVFREAAAVSRSLIFTFAPEPTVPADFFERSEAAVAASGGRMRYVCLTLSDAEQERRIGNADRGAFQKLRSLDILRAIRAAGQPFALPPGAELTLDTGKLDPEAAAAEIHRALDLKVQPAHAMYAPPED